MSHLLEAAVGCEDSSADDPKAFPLHLLAEQVILGKENALMKSSEFPEFFQIKQHEHSSREGMVEAGEVLKQIVAHVEELVDPVAITAKDVGGDTMKPLALGQFDGAANHGSMSPVRCRHRERERNRSRPEPHPGCGRRRAFRRG